MAKRKQETAAGPDPPTRARPPLWTRYWVRWDFLTKVCGSVPADPVLIDPWLKSRQPTVRPAGGRSIQEISEEVIQTLEAGGETTYSMLTFQRHDGVLVARAGTIRAHMKDCARQVSSLYVGHIENVKNYSVRCINGVYLPNDLYWIPYQREDGTLITAGDGTFDKAARGYVGGRTLSFLKNIEYLQRPRLEFELVVLGKSFSEDDLHVLFQYGGTHGYGGERGDGEGRYAYTLERVSDPPSPGVDAAGGGPRDPDRGADPPKV